MSKPLAIDLCCGLGGGGAGLKAAGFKVIGMDIEAWPNEFNDEFILGDICEASGYEITKKYGKISFIWASPPCQEFSYSSFPFKKAREKFTKDNPPSRKIWDACMRLAKECNCPIVLENVRGAVKWMGPAKAHYGSFYLWGDVSALLPIGRPVKGFQGIDTKSIAGKGPLNLLRLKGSPRDGKQWRGNSPLKKEPFPGEFERKVLFRDMPHSRHSSHSSARKLWSAKAAMIPIELSTWIGGCFLPDTPINL